MKKVLLTSTALVAFAGAAAAEVTLSGSAEMGIAGGEGQTAQFFQDVDVAFTMSGETDGGLTFGTKVDLDEAGNLGDSFSNQGVAIFVGGEFGTVTLGDTDSGFTWAIDSIDAWGNPGSIADDETAHWGRQDDFLKGSYDGQVLRYDYSFEDFGFAISVEQDDRSDAELDADDEDRDDYLWSIGASYSPQLGGGTLDLGIGYEQGDRADIGLGLTDLEVRTLADEIIASDWTEDELDALEGIIGFRPQSNESDQLTIALGDDVSVWGLSAGYTMDNGFSVGGLYTQFDGDLLDSGSYWGIGAGYAFDAFSIHANYGIHDFDYDGDAGAGFTAEGYGLSMGYDMGGGLSVLAGYGYSDYEIKAFDEKVSGDFDSYSLGLSMAF